MPRQFKKPTLGFFLFGLVFGLALWMGRDAAASELSPGMDDTILMFVGENLEVLTIASRREESAARAPAVARVITRKDFRESGRDTLSKVLETVPGFYMAEREWGTKPYLRGIPIRPFSCTTPSR